MPHFYPGGALVGDAVFFRLQASCISVWAFVLCSATHAATVEINELPSILGPVRYISTGPDLRGKVINPGSFGSSNDCRLGGCYFFEEPSNNSWRFFSVAASDRAFDNIEVAAGSKYSFRFENDAYIPVMRIKAAPIGPLVQLMEYIPARDISQAFRKIIQTDLGWTDATIYIKNVKHQLRYSNQPAAIKLSTGFRLGVLRDGIRLESDCPGDLCKVFENAFGLGGGVVTRAPVNGAIDIRYSFGFEFDSITSKFITSVDEIEATPSGDINESFPSARQTVEDGIRAKLSSSLTNAAISLNQAFRTMSTTTALGAGINFDLEWKLRTVTVSAWRGSSAAWVANDRVVSRFFDDELTDVYPCQEINPSANLEIPAPLLGLRTGVRSQETAFDVVPSGPSFEWTYEAAPVALPIAKKLRFAILNSDSALQKQSYRLREACREIATWVPPPPQPLQHCKDAHDGEPCKD
jgi:hypothetical protein